VHQGADVPDLLRSALVSAVMRPVAATASGTEIAVPGDSADVDASAATIAVPPPVALRADDDLRAATEALLTRGLREMPVLDAEGRLVGHLDEADISRWYLEATAKDET
jgi:CBS domain-containing protein